jgi:hypothetical protein
MIDLVIHGKNKSTGCGKNEENAKKKRKNK